MNDHDLLLAYGEWLDAQGIIKPDQPASMSAAVIAETIDTRSLEQLATDFLAYRASLHDEAFEDDDIRAAYGESVRRH